MKKNGTFFVVNNQQPPAKQVVCGQRPIEASGAAKATTGKTPAALVLFFFFSALFAPVQAAAEDLPEWAREYGLKSPYSGGRYITGFGMAERGTEDAKSLEAAKTAALDDLIRKIRVQVSSTITTSTADSGRGASSSVSMVSKSISDMKLTNVDFEIASDWKHYYALAYALKGTLRNMHLSRGSEALQKIIQRQNRAESAENSGDIGGAIDIYIGILPYFSEVLENRSIYNVLLEGTYGSRFFSAANIGGIESADGFFRLENKIKNKINTLQKGSVPDMDAALDKIVAMLAAQQLAGGAFQVPPLLYQNSDFTSSFGNYASRKLENLVNMKLGRGGEKIAVRGTYWEKGDSIELMVVAKALDSGKSLGSGFAAFPASSVPGGYDVKPQNAEEALKTQYAIADGAFTDGGLKVDVWTNRGRNEDVLVFSGGESLQLYFKVNQPAFLQLTYDLATGEKVLLEESFYIGMDMVNRVVKYPYEFEVVPPYGVEHLMVTAFSTEPPPANVLIDYIDGERYEVFGDTKAVLAQTRGLRKKQSETGNTEVKVGEAFITLTTMPPD